MIEWSTYQISDPDDGVILVSDLTLEQAKDELCRAIDMIDTLIQRDQSVIALLQSPID